MTITPLLEVSNPSMQVRICEEGDKVIMIIDTEMRIIHRVIRIIHRMIRIIYKVMRIIHRVR